MTDQETITQLRSDLALANQKIAEAQALGHIADKGGVPSGGGAPMTDEWTVNIMAEAEDDPFEYERAIVGDIGHADRILTVRAPFIAELRKSLRIVTADRNGLMAINKDHRDTIASLRAQLESANQRAAMAGEALQFCAYPQYTGGEQSGFLAIIIERQDVALQAFRALTAGEGEKKAE